MCAFNIKQSEMARLSRASKRLFKKKKTYSKRSRTSTGGSTKRSWKSSSKGYKKKSLMVMAKKISTNHYLSYGTSNIRRKFAQPTLRKALLGLGMRTWTDTYGSIAAATSGVQSVTAICGMYTNYDIANSAGASLALQYMKSASLVVNMTNQCNAPVFVDIYETVCRRDVSVDTSTALPSTQWNSTAKVQYGATPFQDQGFTELYKVLKITRLNLTAGETAEHRVSYRPEQLFKDNQLTNSATKNRDQYGYAGLTHHLFMVTRGAACDADDSTVGSAITKVAFIVQKIYKNQYPPASTNTLDQGTSLPTTATKIMELDGDENLFVTA